ncbi:MAG: fused response regulator/phosphatase [Methylococcales bacterium]|jgi:two-component system, HptB-dependent secretion and biofilm response regulator|nr:fused response regulator/phosphatase [Methylococcales bacterium]
MKILIVDSSQSIRMFLAMHVEHSGHEHVLASTGQEAIDLFNLHNIDIIIISVELPDMNGYKTTQAIRKISSIDWVPIIFLSGSSDDRSLAKGLASGGDVYLTKPVSQLQLQGQIQAMTRICDMQKRLHLRELELEKINTELTLKQKLLDEEAQVAKEVFEKITSHNVESDNLEIHLSSMCSFNGDILLSAEHNGTLFVLLGDFTGHGLPAAIGAIPLADTFTTLVSQGCRSEDIMKGINHKLYTALPVNRFCCGALLTWDRSKQTMTIRNAALPDVIMTGNDGKLIKKFPSNYVPLGATSSLICSKPAEKFNLEYGLHFFFYSDGVNETENPEQAFFGTDRIDEVFDGKTPANEMVQRLVKTLDDFCNGAEQSDDISIARLAITK